MSATDTQVTLRASSLRDCPRKAVYEATGAPGRERASREERWLYRGQSIGRDYTIFLASSNGWKITVGSGPTYWVPPELFPPHESYPPELIAERRIPWGHGVGHADIYIPSTKTIVECLSSANASDDLIRSKMLQAVLYTEHDPDATNCRLVVIDPADFSEEQIVLDPKSRTYLGLVEDMRERVAQIERWKEIGELPPRVCSKPSEAQSHFCLHGDHCFEGWEPEPLEELECDETLLDTLTRFDRAKKARSALAKQDKALEVEQKDAQEILDGLDLPVGTVRLGPYEVTRQFTQRKPTFQWEKAETAGVFEPGLYGDYFKPGASFSTFKAERVDMSGDEFGEEAPW